MPARFLNAKVAFAVLAAAFFGYGIYEARTYGYLAKIFPLSISLVMLVLALVNIALEVGPSKAQDETEMGSSFADLETDWDIPLKDIWCRFGVYFGILLLLYGGTWLLGYALSITAFVVLFYKFITCVRWYWAVIAGTAALAFIRLIAKLLVIDWPTGILQQWLDLPWPFS